MTKNYMEEVAKMLGVEIGEQFNVSDPNGFNFGPFILSTEGIKMEGVIGNASLSVLDALLKGEFDIIRQPWMPKEHEEAYVYTARWNTVNGEIINFSHGAFPIRFIKGCTAYLAYLKLGLLFRTKEEAETIGKQRYEQLLEEYKSGKIVEGQQGKENSLREGQQGKELSLREGLQTMQEHCRASEGCHECLFEENDDCLLEAPCGYDIDAICEAVEKLRGEQE